MKLLKNLCKRTTALTLAAVIFSASAVPAGAAISSAYQGYYYCTVDASFHIFFPTDKTSSFRGPFSGLNPSFPGGTFAATNADPDSMNINTKIDGDNMTVRYLSYARLIGDSYVHQDGDFQLAGKAANTSTIYIQGLSSRYTYLK